MSDANNEVTAASDDSGADHGSYSAAGQTPGDPAASAETAADTAPDLANPGRADRRPRLSRRARSIALITVGAIVVSGGVASWAVYNKPELRLVRAIKTTTAQKNMDLTLSFQATAEFLRAMNQGKPLFSAADAPLAGIKTDDDVARAIGNIHLHLRSSSTDMKDPQMMWALQYGSADALAVTLINRRVYLRTQAQELPNQTPALFTQTQFNQVLESLKQPLGPQFADYVDAAQRDVLRKIIDFAQGQTLFFSLAPDTELGKWWDTTVVAQSTAKNPSVSGVQKQISALGTRIQSQLRKVASVKDLADDATGDRMRISINVATLVKLNSSQILDLAAGVSGLPDGGGDFDRAQATKELNAWLAEASLKSFSTDVWIKDNRFRRVEVDMANVLASSLPKKVKVAARGAVMRMDLDDIAVTAPADAVEFTESDIKNAGGLLGGLFMGGLASSQPERTF